MTIDAADAREDKMKFPNANNGIIVARGFSGTIPFRFATSIIAIRTGEVVYDKEGDPQWVLQKEKEKEKEDEEASKSSSKEVANVTTPDNRSVSSPCRSASSKLSKTSKGSYYPERTFDTTKGNSANPYSVPKAARKEDDVPRPTSRESIKIAQPIVVPLDRGRCLEARTGTHEGRAKSQNTVRISPSRSSARTETKVLKKRKKSRESRDSSDKAKEPKRAPLVYSILEFQRQKQLGGSSEPSEPTEKRKTD